MKRFGMFAGVSAALFGAAAPAHPIDPQRAPPPRALTGAAPSVMNQRQDVRGPLLFASDADRLEAVADVLEGRRQRGQGADRASAKKIRWMRRVADQIRHERFFERAA